MIFFKSLVMDDVGVVSEPVVGSVSRHPLIIFMRRMTGEVAHHRLSSVGKRGTEENLEGQN